MKRHRIVITGLGVVSSIGLGWRAFWDALLAGRSGIHPISYLDTADFPTHNGGEVPGFDPAPFMDATTARHLGRGSQFAVAATQMALDDAKLGIPLHPEVRAGVCLGTTMADIQALESVHDAWVARGERRLPALAASRYPACLMATQVAKRFGFCGPAMMIPTACAAGNYALAYAFDALQLGTVDIMVAGGAEPFSRIVFTGFNRLLAVAPERCQPFDKHRKGMMVGEGAAVLVLERLEDAAARHAPIYVELLGYGMSCDAHHMTIPHVEGITRVMRNALHHAQVLPDEVDYISAHGTGTPANDRTECQAIREVFEGHADQLPVSSIKSMLGHAMGAASALEAVACTLAVHTDVLPPTINFETPDPECPIDCVPNVKRAHRVQRALNNSFAFGGNNACVAFGKSS
jgi:3-oxoacyl-[acyl-carrier-protein] synthase II